MTQVVLYEVEGAIATVTLNRPDRLNTMTPALLDSMGDALEAASEDPQVRVVIVTGSGRAFCAGGELRGISKGQSLHSSGGPASKEEEVQRLKQWMRSSVLVRTMPKATIAKINGPCAGAGLALACACDLRYCGRSAVFNTAFLTAGVSGDFGGTWTLPRVVGPAKARELYLISEKFSSVEAERIGLVTRCLPDELLGDEVSRVAERLAGLAPLALAAAKENLNDSAVSTFEEQMALEADRFIRCRNSEDAREAASAYLEKRPPLFQGR